ncbi:protein phosphatase 2C domain-containing protein [Micromonospora sp. NPDC049114]|uniref:PP2C family protein-serine/threonine phosphatase n=1 Tax=Micromonospora sp. NPDC049114 TaxID=3155498 RepID=UPI0033D23D9F
MHPATPARLRGSPADVLGRAVNAANDALGRRIKTEPELAGMGTTLVAMLISGTTAALANVGDSRAHLLHGQGPQRGQTTQITEDHVYGGRLVADAADVPNLPERLARFLDGRLDGRSPDITLLTLQSGDRFLLCSDGLSSYVPLGLIHVALAATPSPAEAVDRLITTAFDHGGPDNITVAVSTSSAQTARSLRGKGERGQSAIALRTGDDRPSAS